MFEYRVFDDRGHYLGKVVHERELVRHQYVIQNDTIYRINHVGSAGTIRVSEAVDTVWEAEIQPPNT